MPKDDKTQEPEDKGQEEETQQSPEEQDELFSEGFKDATENKKPDSTDKDDEDEEEGEKGSGTGDKDKSGKKGESDGSKGKDSTAKKSEKEGEGEEEGEAKKEIEERAKRLKGIMEGTGKEEEDEEEEKKPKKKATKKAAKKVEPEEEEDEDEDEDDPKSLLKGVKLSEAEKDFIEDMPEVGGILSKILKKALKNIDVKAEVPDEVMEALQNQDKQIAVLRTQVVLTKLVPDWEELVFDGNKLLDTGERAPNQEFWDWMKKQPDLYRALANSDNPKDNAAVLKYYKEDRAKEQLKDKDDESNKNLKKVQDLHSHSANDQKTVKKQKKSVDEDDFGGHFGEAAKKAAKGQL